MADNTALLLREIYHGKRMKNYNFLRSCQAWCMHGRLHLPSQKHIFATLCVNTAYARSCRHLFIFLLYNN